MSFALELAFWLVAAGWAVATLSWTANYFRVPGFRGLDADPARIPGPVSVVVAARDEASRIGETVRRLAAQTVARLELIVVDDRSTDDTPRILRRLESEFDRLTVVRVDALPDGWIGKCHALQRGAEIARGDWILFTDADAWIEPDGVARAVLAAIDRDVEHVCLVPTQPGIDLGGRATFVAFVQMFVASGAAANADRRFGGFVGTGAFNLVRADAYRAIGGHERLRTEILDDVKLGLLLRRAGYRTRCFFGEGAVEVHWAASAADVVRRLEKNLFAMVEFRPGLAAAIVALNVVSLVLPPLGLAFGTPAGLAAGAAWLSCIAPAALVSRRLGFGLAPAPLAPAAFALLPLALLRSTWLALRDGGVRWRDTFYPLETLRRGVVPVLGRRGSTKMDR